jgi:hypothetical protein
MSQRKLIIKAGPEGYNIAENIPIYAYTDRYMGVFRGLDLARLAAPRPFHVMLFFPN